METDHTSAERRVKYLSLAGLIIYMVGSRFAYLKSIPGFLWDEGGWLIGAKNLVLFGHTTYGDVHFHFVSPLYHLLMTGVFSLTGPAIPVARAVSALMGLGCLGMLYLVVKQLYSRQIAWISLMLLTFNGIMTINNRSAILETPQLFFMLISAWFLLKPQMVFRFLAMVAFVCALLIKANAVYFALPLAALFMASQPTTWQSLADLWHRYWKWAALAGCLLITILILLFRDQSEHFFNAWYTIVTFHYGIPNVHQMLHSAAYFAKRMPFTLILTGIGLMHSIRYHRKTDAFILTWMAAGILMHVILIYQPYWYYYTLIPPACVMSACFLHRTLIAPSHGTQRKRLAWTVVGGICLFQFTAITGYYFVLGKRDLSRWQMANYITHHITSDKTIMAPHYIGVNIPNPTIGPSHSTKEDIYDFQVDYIVVRNNPEEAIMMKINSDRAFLARACEPIFQINDLTLYRVRQMSATDGMIHHSVSLSEPSQQMEITK